MEKPAINREELVRKIICCNKQNKEKMRRIIDKSRKKRFKKVSGCRRG